MNNRAIAIGGTLLGVAVGSVAGYFVAKSRLEAKYAQFASEEIAQAKDYYSMLHKKDEYATPGAVLDKRMPTTPGDLDDSVIDMGREVPDVEILERVVKGLRYGPPDVVVQEPVKRNVFADHTDDPEEDEEPDDGSNIRIISVNEFMAGELNHAQVTLTYFAADDVLADDSDMPIEDVEATVGIANLERFGHRSKDPKVVYVRNVKLSTDFEICHHEGSFAESVHGIVQPRSKEKVRKMPKE